MLMVGQLGQMLKTLKEFDAGYALMAGQITPRRLFKGLHPDLKAARMLALAETPERRNDFRRDRARDRSSCVSRCSMRAHFSTTSSRSMAA